MGWENIKITPSQLDKVKREALKLEFAYMLERSFLPLKVKYRPVIGAYSQFGCGGDFSGKAQQKQAKTAKTKQDVSTKVMRVNGKTGKAVMV